MALTRQLAAAITVGDASATTVASNTFDSTGFTHLAFFVKHEGAPTTITPSDNKGSTGWSSLTKVNHTDNGDLSSQLHWVKIGTPGSGHTVTMTFGASRPFRKLGGWLINATTGNIELIAGTDLTVQGTGTATIDAGSIVTDAAAILVMGVGEYSSVTYTPGTGWTEDWDDSNSFGQSRSEASPGTFDPVCTMVGSTADFTANAAAFKEVAGGGSTQAPRSMHQYGLRRRA